MTRIISGRAGGRRLLVPAGAATRPTSDRVREGLFSRLEHLEVLAGAVVADLYAGSGALGLEAASRGAATVVLVESERTAVSAARANVAALALPQVRVAPMAVEAFLALPPPRPFDLVLADPPYDVDETVLGRVLGLVAAPGVLSGDGLVVVERSARSPEPSWPVSLELMDERRYGETRLWYTKRVEPDAVA